MIDENGAPVTEAEVISKPTLVYFGYTYCPDICPTDNARNAEAIDLLAAAGHDVEMALITVDPVVVILRSLRRWRGPGAARLCAWCSRRSCR